MTGRIAVKTGPQQIELREYPVPDPEPGAIVVRMRQSGMCGSDLHGWREEGALPQTGAPVLRTVGHEGFGTVHTLGNGVHTDFRGDELREGDRVVWYGLYGCNRCVNCMAGLQNLCRTKNTKIPGQIGEFPYFYGTFGDYCYLPSRHPVFKVPAQLADEEVVALNCAMGTVYQALLLSGACQGSTIVILGAGGLGLYATAFATGLGAQEVVVIDRLQPRLAMATQMGATATIDATKLSTAKMRCDYVLERTKGKGADVFIDLVGAYDLMQEGLDMLTEGGTFMNIGGIVAGRKAVFESTDIIRRSIRIIGSAMYPSSVMPKLLDFLVKDHAAPLEKVISHKFPLAELKHAYEASDWAAKGTEIIRSAIVP